MEQKSKPSDKEDGWGLHSGGVVYINTYACPYMAVGVECWRAEGEDAEKQSVSDYTLLLINTIQCVIVVFCLFGAMQQF